MCVWLCVVVVVRDQQMTSPLCRECVCSLLGMQACESVCLECVCLFLCPCECENEMNACMESMLISGSSLQLAVSKLCRPFEATLHHLLFVALRDCISCWYTLSCQINYAINSFIKYPPFNGESTCSCKIMGSEVLSGWWAIRSVLWITWIKLKPTLSGGTFTQQYIKQSQAVCMICVNYILHSQIFLTVI